MEFDEGVNLGSPKNVELKYISDDSSDTTISEKSCDHQLDENAGIDEITAQLEYFSNFSPVKRVSREYSPDPEDNKENMAPILKGKSKTIKKATKPPKKLVFSEGNENNFPFSPASPDLKGPPKKRQRKDPNVTTKERLLSWIRLYSSKNYGIWVQCFTCQKWRWIKDCEEPYELPNIWVCPMNTDLERNFCDAPAENFDTKDVLESEVRYVPGSIVWAKCATFPWWPAMVEDDPDVEEYFWGDEEKHCITQYHVTFLDKKVTRSWVPVGKIRPFLEKENIKHMTGLNKALVPYLFTAQERASDAIKLTLGERLQKYSFVFLWKGKWPTARKYSDDEEIENKMLELSLSQTNDLMTEVDKIEDLSASQSGSQKQTSVKVLSELPSNYSEFLTSLTDTMVVISSSQSKTAAFSNTMRKIEETEESRDSDTSLKEEFGNDVPEAEMNESLIDENSDTEREVIVSMNEDVVKEYGKKMNHEEKLNEPLMEENGNTEINVTVSLNEDREEKLIEENAEVNLSVLLNKEAVTKKKRGKKMSHERKLNRLHEPLIKENENINDLMIEKVVDKKKQGKKKLNGPLIEEITNNENDMTVPKREEVVNEKKRGKKKDHEKKLNKEKTKATKDKNNVSTMKKKKSKSKKILKESTENEEENPNESKQKLYLRISKKTITDDAKSNLPTENNNEVFMLEKDEEDIKEREKNVNGQIIIEDNNDDDDDIFVVSKPKRELKKRYITIENGTFSEINRSASLSDNSPSALILRIKKESKGNNHEKSNGYNKKTTTKDPKLPIITEADEDSENNENKETVNMDEAKMISDKYNTQDALNTSTESIIENSQKNHFDYVGIYNSQSTSSAANIKPKKKGIVKRAKFNFPGKTDTKFATTSKFSGNDDMPIVKAVPKIEKEIPCALNGTAEGAPSEEESNDGLYDNIPPYIAVDTTMDINEN